MSDETQTDDALESDETANDTDLGDGAKTRGSTTWTDPDPQPTQVSGGRAAA